MKGAIDAGVPRVSADLIFGLPDQSPEEARREALELADLGLAHLSGLPADDRARDTLRRARASGAACLSPTRAHVADAFLAIDEALGERGLRHYEISNYAQAGEEARHNLGYWRGDEYLGLGCGAYGFTREPAGSGERPAPATRPALPALGLRWRNEVVPERYVSASPAGAGTLQEPLDGETLLRERIMLGLRVAEGIDLEAIALDLGVVAWTPERRRASAWLAARGRIVAVGSRIKIPRAAWLWADDTAARLF